MSSLNNMLPLNKRISHTSTLHCRTFQSNNFITPGPGAYNIRSSFNTLQSKLPPKSQQLIRRCTNFVTPSSQDYSPLNNTIQCNQQQVNVFKCRRQYFKQDLTPAPNQYNIKCSKGVEILIKSKYQQPQIDLTPGPDQYQSKLNYRQYRKYVK
ncbi:hypothetical protein SS50377_24695 [Spironucleus salmonicida]|uniref:SHIPPO 1-like protein n=1 Tax=Spironucleus salmonicida TaxID=348837 RepID=A0A9P8RX34_9EUKA|nr:hypothetical protein SS50377_24695 [Spironucleus salmonicida]